MNCKHPPTRLYSWFAYDGTLCVGCCDCGEVLAGAADDSEPGGAEAHPAHRIKTPRVLSRPGKRHNHRPRRKKE